MAAVDRSCRCQGFDNKTPCEGEATQEDLLCDHCRTGCYSAQGIEEKRKYLAWVAAGRPSGKGNDPFSGL